MRIHAMIVLLNILALGIAAGCRRDSRYDSLPELVPVGGKVTLDGKPLPRATLTFTPVGTTRGQISYGVTDENGQYEAMLDNDHKGLPVGEFKVLCNKWVMPNGSDFPADSKVPPGEAGAKELLPPRYSQEGLSQLKATVPAGGGTIDFPLKSGRR